MRVLVAMDSFKGSLTSLEAGNAAKEGILAVYPNADITVCPLADGGEGTVDALGATGEFCDVTVTGPLGEPVAARYCILPETGTAVMEMAAAAGLTLVPEEKRDPMITTTYGVGEMIRHAIGRGCRRFMIGIGGSATNDGGTGMLSALGFRFLDEEGCPIPMGARGLRVLSSIDTGHALPELGECEFRIACDVKNPLCGQTGCSAVFAPQKGADQAAVRQMDAWLCQYAQLTRSVIPDADPDTPGAGAAGGLGFAFSSYLRGKLSSGVGLVLGETGIEAKIRNSDIVITGEGRLDAQSVMGKAPVGVAALAKKYEKPVIAFAGCLGEGAEACNHHGIDAFFSITPGAVSLEEAMDPQNACRNLRNTVCQVFRLMAAEKDWKHLQLEK